jgi:cytoskeletal protein RodZ
MQKRIKLVHACLLLLGAIALCAALVLGWGLASSTAVQTVPSPRPKVSVASATSRSVSLPPIPPQATTPAPVNAAQAKTDPGLPSNENLGKFLRGEIDSSVP